MGCQVRRGVPLCTRGAGDRVRPRARHDAPRGSQPTVTPKCFLRVGIHQTQTDPVLGGTPTQPGRLRAVPLNWRGAIRIRPGPLDSRQATVSGEDAHRVLDRGTPDLWGPFAVESACAARTLVARTHPAIGDAPEIAG